MRLHQEVVGRLRVAPGAAAGLAHRPTAGRPEDWLGGEAAHHPKDVAGRELQAFKEELDRSQGLLYAVDRWSLLLIFQALDAAGKDGTIRHVMSGVNPQGCQVASFKQPSSEELAHDFLWRCILKLPERGRIGIFNRSYYEEVLVVRVHPELLAAQHLAPGTVAGPKLWRKRFDDINAFEHHLSRAGTKICKFFLHVSKAEQRRRFLARLDDPAKRWKFSASDVAERHHFDAYQQAYEEALSATSTTWAPWYVIPADHKPTMRALVAGLVVDAIESLELTMPQPDPEERAAQEQARRELQADSAG